MVGTVLGTELARRYGVTKATISNIKNRVVYRDVGDEP